MSNFEEHIQAVVNRANAFYRKTEPGHYLISTRIPNKVPPSLPLYAFDLDYQLAQDREYLRAKESLDDDTIPAVCPFFGIAEHSAWLGAEVLLQEDTCMPILIIREPADLIKLHFRRPTNGSAI